MTDLEMGMLLNDRGTAVCRACGGRHLESVLDLGLQPLANELLDAPDGEEGRYPLHLRICTSCGLGQVGEVVLPERIFSDYPYFSSVSTSWLEHGLRYTERVHEELALDETGLVIEVASNDGYLLQHFVQRGVPVLGIEPATNIALVAEAAGVRTLNAFFGRETAQSVVAAHGHPSLVAANNVMAHVPDLDDFTGGLAILCDQRTVVTVENPTFAGLLEQTQFDTIYHEHYSYLSAHAVSRLVARHGLELFRVEQLPTHGGSNRYWLARAGARPVEASVDGTIAAELASGLLDHDNHAAFRSRSRATIDGLRSWLDEGSGAGRSVAAYGAAAKGNTLLNAAGVTAQSVVAVADANPHKQGRFLPGSRIPIVAPEDLPGLAPTDVLVLPWNLGPELRPLLEGLLDARVWIAVPSMARLTA